MKKNASILDYSYPFLDPAIWDHDRNLFAYQKDFILRLTSKMYETYGLMQPETWIDDIVIIGSLTTSKWLLTSDLDAHIRVNLDAFIASNIPGSTKEQAFEKLDTIRKEFDRAKILAPMTQHPIEFYFESIEFKPSNVSLVGVYSLKQNAWLKEPIIFEADLDFEESKKDVVAQAEALAEELDGSLGKIQRDIQRVDELEAVIQAWGKDKQQLFYAKVEQKLKDIEAEILKDLQIKQDLVDARHADQNATSDIEIKFKWLARFGFFGILSNLKTLLEQTGGQVTTQELPLIEKIISEGSLNSRYWLAPDGNEFVVPYSHLNWIRDNQDYLDLYGIKDENPGIASNKMIESGWVRVIIASEYGNDGMSMLDIHNVPAVVDTFVAKHSTTLSHKIYVEDSNEIVTIDWDDAIGGVQKAVNKALSQKRLQPIASIKEATIGDDHYWIEPSGQIDHVYSHNEFIRSEGLLEKEAIELGWIRVFVYNNSIDILLNNLTEFPQVLKDFIIEHSDADTKEILVEDLKGNIKSLELPKLPKKESSIKEAFLKEAFDKEIDTQIAIDFDGTIAKDKKFPDIGEPEEGVKKALSKIQDMGYEILIYTCRSKDAEGLELVREYLDKHEIPYDNIFEGEKPFAKFYIDDRAIHFDNWNNVLKQVEKSEKQASLIVVSYERTHPAFWIDPSGTKYSVDTTHEAWILDNTKLLQDQYGLWNNHSEELYPEETDNVNAIIPKMLQDGWVRIGDLFGSGRKFLGNGVEIEDLTHVPNSVFEYASNFGPGAYLMIEDLQHHWVELEVSALLEGGQEAVDYALKQQNAANRAVAASINLPVIDPKTLNRKEPYALYIGTGDYGKAGKIDMFNVYGEHPMITKSNALPTVTLDTLVQNNIPVIGKETRAGDKQPFQDLSQVIKLAFSKKEIVAFNPYENDALKQGPAYAIFEHTQKGLSDFNVPDIHMYTILGDHPLFGSTVSEEKIKELGIPVRQQKQAKTKKVKQGDYSCLMALVPHDLAQEIVEWGVRNVPDKDLYLDDDGKLGRELESHITIKYGLLTNDAKHVRRSFNDDKPFHAKLGKVRHFQPPELPFDVLTVEIISEDLQKANTKVCDKFECAEGLVSDEYKPHITIAYMKRDKAHEYVGFDGFDGKEVELDTIIFSPHKGNRTYFSISNDKESSFILEQINKTASGDNFLPSFCEQPANDEWQFQEGGDDVEIALQPDSVSDDITEYEPCTTGKPRTKEVWRQFISMFQNPFSKNEDVTINSAYDPEMDEKEKQEMGLDQTQLEYSKGFYDPKKHDFPHNTTWDSLTQDGEPSKPTSVTYSPQISNEDNLDQNSPGGFPRRFMGKPKGEWFSDEGEVVPALQNMWKYRDSALDSMTIDITADLSNAYWIDPNGNEFQVRGSNFGSTYSGKDTHDGWINNNLLMLKTDYGIEPRKDAFGTHLNSTDLIQYGWIRIGDSYGKDWSVSVKNLDNIPSSVDNLLAKFAPEGANIEVFAEDNGANETIEWPVKSIQQAVNKARLQPVAFSKKELNKIAITRQYALYVGGRLAIRTLTRQKALKICQERFPEFFARGDYEVKEEAYTVAKQASANEDGGWISPSGQYIPTADHFGYVDMHLEDFDLHELRAIPTPFERVSAIIRSEQHIFDQGWIRVRVWGDAIMIQTNTFQNAQAHAEDFIYNNLANTKRIRIETNDEQAYTCTSDEFKVEGWSAFLKQPVMAKQAGDQSASVPDYLINEWKTEQINNDTDEEPYVNHDQRDYPYGMHDSPENTGYNIGWAKDNQPYVVRLDILENPAYRSDPFGIGEYNVTWYTSLPASDGIETTNPE